MKLDLSPELGSISLSIDEVKNAQWTIILAHGAGAGMNHPFMREVSMRLNKAGCTVIRFNFPYMEAGKRFPGSPKKNIETWSKVVEFVLNKFPKTKLLCAGKSYGGRMASHYLAETPDAPVKGVIYFGFPLHAPGKASTARVAHLNGIAIPQLFLQGERDKLASIELIRKVVSHLEKAELWECELADHSFKVPKSSGLTHQQVLDALVQTISSWLQSF